MKNTMKKPSGLLRAACICCLGLLPATKTIAQDTTLKDFAPFKFGAAINASLLKNNASYRAIVTREYNSITPENAMKFATIHPSQSSYNWTDADTIVNFAQQYGKRIHGHTLIWYNSLPSWVTNFTGDSTAWENLMKTHIQTVVIRYKGKLTSWDVVNEAFEDDGTLRNSVWLQHLGSNYIARAFQYAHQADSNALLFYNDYGHEYSTAKLNAIKDLIRNLVSSGVPINGAGLQMHTSKSLKNGNIQDAIDTMLATGVMVHIAELDISMNPENNPSLTYTQTIEAQQFAKYKFISRIVSKIPANKCYGITTWNVTDRDSWIQPTYNRPDFPLPFDSFYHKKAAYQAIKDGSAASWNFDSSSCRTIAGGYNDLGTNGTAITTNINGGTMAYDNDNSSVQNIGFNFRYNGSVYSTFVLNTNGYIKLGSAPSTAPYFYTTYNNMTGGTITATDIDLIYPYNHDLKAGTGTPEYRVYTSGTSGIRVCTIQYKNVADKLAPLQYANMNFQIKLYEETGAVEFIYGAWTAGSGTATVVSGAIGIKGVDASETVNVSKGSATAWSAGMTVPSVYDFTNGNYPTTGPSFNTIKTTLPDVGRIYRFTPSYINLTDVADAYLRDGSYGNDNYGTDTLLQLKNDASTGFTRIDYLKFKVPPQARGSVGNAKLKLYMPYANTDANTTQWQLYLVADDNWTETGITFNNRPAYSTLLSTVAGNTSLGYEYWDVTGTLKTLGTDTVSFALVSSNAGGNTNVNFLSRECATAERRPQLVITTGTASSLKTPFTATLINGGKNSAPVIAVYPNPAGCCITVSNTGNGQRVAFIKLYSQLGQLLMTKEMHSNTENIDISQLTPGIYYLQWLSADDNGVVATTQKKILKQ